MSASSQDSVKLCAEALYTRIENKLGLQLSVLASSNHGHHLVYSLEPVNFHVESELTSQPSFGTIISFLGTTPQKWSAVEFGRVFGKTPYPGDNENVYDESWHKDILSDHCPVCSEEKGSRVRVIKLMLEDGSIKKYSSSAA